MLRFYLSTILMFAVIIYASLMVCLPTMRQKKWFKSLERTSAAQGLATIFAVAAVPIIRLLVVVGIYVLTFKEDEE